MSNYMNNLHGHKEQVWSGIENIYNLRGVYVNESSVCVGWGVGGVGDLVTCFHKTTSDLIIYFINCKTISLSLHHLNPSLL